MSHARLHPAARLPRPGLTVVVLAGSALTLGSALGRPSSGLGAERGPHPRGPGVANHPVFVRPSAAVSIPKDWPLDRLGAITCKTCHLSLAPGMNGNGFASSGSVDVEAGLRGAVEGASNSRGFCANCHLADGPRTAAGMHWMAVGRAHVTRDSDDVSAGDGFLDAESRQCLGCHDGVGAMETAYQTARENMRTFVGDQGRNHPIGRAYVRGANRAKGISLVSPSMLPDTVRLPGGNLGCVSCHNLYSTEPKRLSVPIEGSALCMTCHDMN